jgi:hypothetical protein
MNIGPDDIYHVNESGERVTWETCTCWGCHLERQMREVLDFIDERYKKRAEALSYGALFPHPRDARRLQHEWGSERWRIVQAFARAGWHGCHAPLVIALPPQRQSRADVQAKSLEGQHKPADLDDAHERDGADEPHRDA